MSIGQFAIIKLVMFMNRLRELRKERGFTQIDPTEGNFSLTESVAVVDKGDATNPLAQEMAQCIIGKGRSELQKYYPKALYEGETTSSENASAYPKTFAEPLTVELLESHQALSESCK